MGDPPEPPADPPRLWRALTAVPRRLSPRRTLLVATAMVIAAGIGDRETGVELPFTLLYLLPIGLAAWFGSARAGVALALLSTAAVAAALLHDGASGLSLAWNTLGSAALFGAASAAVAALRDHVLRERAARRMAIDQLRHAERLNVLGTMAAGVAHELGTPMGVIAGCAELLRDDAPDERARRRAATIEAQIARMSTIIRRMLEFGRRGPVEPREVELGPLIDASVAMVRATARARGCAIVVEAPTPAVVRGTATELEQVITNLLANAIQASRDATINVSLHATTHGSQAVAVIAVEDHGTGIRPEHLPHVFDPFFTTKDVGEGTGLGLSISHGIVRDHGGSIAVHSELGRGSRFEVTLPRVAP